MEAVQDGARDLGRLAVALATRITATSPTPAAASSALRAAASAAELRALWRRLDG